MSTVDPLLTYRQLRALVPYCTKHVRTLVAQGRFPAPVRVGRNRVAFRSSEVRAWLEKLPRVGSDG
jgi:predicted DNA-binding transcriptional regulator AlpA